ncbi:MAG: hypothetical protein Q9160_007695 [Pyrenula sp. 1 TL-2023]
MVRGKPAKIIFQVINHPLRLLRVNLVLLHVGQRYQQCRYGSTTSRTRNIGIIAHIDAGKTTTTERMLYYSGYTRSIGNVDDGNTVTDFLPAERARGITIQSAAISFKWPPEQSRDDQEDAVRDGKAPLSSLTHDINLIDTPGHADFTFEVRRSLRVLDGAICILDGVAGVEAQTEQVWKQADEWKIPRIAFVNKLDRDGAAFGKTVKEIGNRLQSWPLVTQIPWFEKSSGSLIGLGDVVNLRGLLYKKGGDGKELQTIPFSELPNHDPAIASELQKARHELIEILSEHDDILVDKFFEEYNSEHLSVPPVVVVGCIRRCLLGSKAIVPVLCGASFRNIGVQPLLDAVLDFLPSPEERPDPDIKVGTISGGLQQYLDGHLSTGLDFGNDQKKKAKGLAALEAFQGCALAFKVVHDTRRGALVYIRVYSGTIDRGAILYNTTLHQVEKAQILLKMFGSDAQNVSSVPAGQIGVIAGLKHARTGDTLVSYQGRKDAPSGSLATLQLRPIDVPPPLFYQSLEAESLSEERSMMNALQIMIREDPSLTLTHDEDTGQTLLSGMGDLHLEIAQNRLVNDLKAKARLGRIEIGYRETILQPSRVHDSIYDKEIAGRAGRAGCTAQVIPFDPVTGTLPETTSNNNTSHVSEHDSNFVHILSSIQDGAGFGAGSTRNELEPAITMAIIQDAYITGAIAALARGARYSFPAGNVLVQLKFEADKHYFSELSTAAAFTQAAKSAIQAALRDASSQGIALLEPVMDVTINVDEASMGSVAQDIQSSRGGMVVSLGDEAISDESASSDLIIDATRIYVPPDQYSSPMSGNETLGSGSRLKAVKAKVPLKEMQGYLNHLRSMTGGRGTFVMKVDKFEKVTGHREKALRAQLSGLN